MGIGFVLLFWAVVGTIAATIAAVVFGAATSIATSHVSKGRRLAIFAAIIFPFTCLAWAGAVFIFQAVVNEAIFHRDAGLGDSWRCLLPSGYTIFMIDTTDNGWVFNPKTQPGSAIGEQDDAIAGVAELELADQYILGRSIDAFSHVRQPDSFFLLDTQSGKHKTFATRAELREGATFLKTSLHFESIASVYARYRRTWFDALSAALFFSFPVVGTCLLILYIRRLRNQPAVTG
jgi:hypothetical protein